MENQKAKEWIEEQDFLWLSVTETERLIKAYEAGQKDSEAQMKCCGNCKKLRSRFDHNTHINILYCSDSDMKQIEVGFQMCCCKWEIKEK